MMAFVEMPVMRPFLLLLLLVATSAADPFAADRAAWLRDVGQPAWWTTVTVAAGDPTALVLPPGNPTPPKPAIDGCFHRSELSAFVGYPLLNHRNAIRLLGKPTSSAAQGQAWVITWNRAVVVEVDASADPAQSLVVRRYGLRVIIGNNGHSFTWERLGLDGRALEASEQIL
jgi:hypothetical protein